MTQRQRLAAATTVLTLAAGGLGYYASSDPSGGGQRAARLLAKGCDVTITSPAADIDGTAKLSAGQSLAVTLQGKALRCPAGTVSVYASVDGGAESLLGTATVSAAGAWTYGPTTLTDNARTTLRAAMSVMVDDASRPTEARLVVDSAAARPRLVLAVPAPNPGGRAYVVAPAADGGCGSGGNPHAEKGEPGYYHDLACGAGGQVSPSLTVYGAAPGTLTVSYGVTPLATVSVTTDPQTFTAAELGTWTLDDWTRDDLVVRAAKDGDAGVAQVVVDLQVGTGVPPAISCTTTVVNKRGADFDISCILPSTPAPVRRPTIEHFWTTSTLRMAANVNHGTVALSGTPTALPTAPGTCAIQYVENEPVADAGVPIWCSFNADTANMDAGYKVLGASYSYSWLSNIQTFDVEGDAGLKASGYSECGSPSEAKATIYCATAPGGTGSVGVNSTACCAEFTHDWANTRATRNGYTYPRADHVVTCWGDGTETSDAGTAVQLWRCKDGRQYRGGETYVHHITGEPPFNTYYFHTEVRW